MVISIIDGLYSTLYLMVISIIDGLYSKLLKTMNYIIEQGKLNQFCVYMYFIKYIFIIIALTDQ